jgi:hypothetical protein
MGERRGAYRILVGKPDGKRPLRRPRRRWENNIKMNLQEVGCGGMDWIELAQDRDRWRALEKLNNLYSSLNIFRVIKSRRIRWVGHVARMGAGRGVYRFLVGKTEGKRPLEIPRRRWERNIKMDLRKEGCGDMDWIELAEDRDRWRALVNAVMYLRVP